MMVLLDTTAIIHGLAGRLPVGAAAMVRGARQFHCSVCLGEVAVGLGHYSPAAADAASVKAGYIRAFAAISRHRVLTPNPEVWIGAGLVAGTLARTQHFGRDQRKELMNDALIYLTAAKFGLPVLTENRREFDLIQQVAGHGRFIFYKAVGSEVETG